MNMKIKFIKPLKKPPKSRRVHRIHRSFIGILTTVAVLITLLPISVFTASAATEWDGVSALAAGKTYTITGEITLRGDLNVPEGTSLLIMKGGALKLNKTDSNSYVRGTLSVAIGGTFELVRGTLNLVEKGALNIYGDMLVYTTGTLKLAGAFTVYNQGNFKNSGVTLIYRSSKILFRRYAMFTKASVTTLTGSITVDKGAEMHMQGQLSVTKSGELTNKGYMTVGRNAIVKSSGSVTVEKGASLLQYGSWTDTVSGRFVDHNNNNGLNIADKYTTRILENEPESETYGIDVSQWQGDIDWEKVAQSGVSFAILRAARGHISATNVMKTDDYFTQNIEGALAAGLHVGVYFYSYAYTPEEAVEEARFLLDLIRDYDIAYPVVFDMEENFAGLDKDDFTDIAIAFMGEIADAGYFPMLYSNPWWISVHLDMERLSDIAVWVADWGEKTSYTGDYYIWQYSAKGKVSGVSTDADMNISYRDFPAIFEKYGLNNLSANYPVNPPNDGGGEEESAQNPGDDQGFIDEDGDGIADDNGETGDGEELPAEEE
jgi:GH25 family lysozyme M1 (1,4-beta-N-acetylmuramidase)